MPGVYRHSPRPTPHAGVRDLSWRQPAFNALLPNNSIQGVIYSGGALSLQAGVTPPVVIGDTFQVSNTSPANHLVQVNADGTIEIFAGGDTSRQSIQFQLFRRIPGTYDGPSIIWVNELPPVWTSPIVISVQVLTAITPVNLADPFYVASPSGDVLTFSLASGTLPPGITLSGSGIISGTPASLGVYSFTADATDITGTSTASPASLISVVSPFVPPPPNPPQPASPPAINYGPRVWGRIYNPDGTYTWVAVVPNANGSQSYLNITWLIQVLKLNLAESPLYSNYGIPAQQSVITQIFPDYYVQQVQQQFSQFFASLQITKQPVPEPTYNVAITTFEGTIFNEDIPV